MTRITPQYYQENSASRSRLEWLKKLVENQGRTIPDDFDVDEISWVTDRLGITDFEGSEESVLQNYFTICVAGELDSSAQIKADLDPYSGRVTDDLTELAALIHKVLTESDDSKVVVHCAMGMERSPLTVVWYLHTYHDMSIDDAYDLAIQARPVVCDRREWIDS